MGKGGGKSIADTSRDMDDLCIYCSAAPAHRTRLRIGAAGFCSEICEYEALKSDNWDQTTTPTEEDGPDAESEREEGRSRET